MRLPISLFVVSLASVIAFAGCDPGSTLQSEPVTSPTPAASFSEVIPYGNPNSTALAAFASQQRASLQEEYGLLRAQLVDILEADGPTQEKSIRIKRILSSQSDSPLTSYLEQFAAHGILRRLLDESNPSSATIGYYSHLLVRNENPDAELLHRAFGHLTGEWSRDRLAKAARATSVRAREWAARVCTKCSNGKDDKAARNPSLMLKHGRILDAANRLGDFVGP